MSERTCRFYTEEGPYRCTLTLFGGFPTKEDCDSCDRYQGPDRGAGDKVANFFKKTGVEKVVKAVSGGKDCGCGKRRSALNKALPCKDKSDA